MNGASLSFFYALPFVGLLLSIATGPVLFAHFWERHYGKITFFWAALVLLMLGSSALPLLVHTALHEYLPFIILIFALFCVAGGIVIKGNLHGSPLMNVILLSIGTFLASFVGTAGASMIMIRPLLRANDNRRHNVHVVVFFIFLVSNIGGSLTPLGDPPLFFGFLRGVSFFWSLQQLWLMTLISVIILLVVFYLLDSYFYAKEEGFRPLQDPTPDSRIRVEGKLNFLFIGVIIGAILLSALWKPQISIFGVELQNIVRDFLMLASALASLFLTSKDLHEENKFSFAPILEVAKLFAGIFTCMIPVIVMLQAGKAGAFAPLVTMVSHPNGTPNITAYFWISGILSSFLDNAPTYLIFFELAGGDAAALMKQATVLTAISAATVFMGANSYIGNAPNFMVYAIAKEAGVKMPSFFGYMAWSFTILIPLFLLLTYLFF